MPEFTWILLDPDSKELRATDAFSSKEEAEAWMGDHWSGLADEGAEYVSLRSDGEQLYKMGLGEA